jgi:hypothetical protein
MWDVSRSKTSSVIIGMRTAKKGAPLWNRACSVDFRDDASASPSFSLQLGDLSRKNPHPYPDTGLHHSLFISTGERIGIFVKVKKEGE